MLIFVYGTLKRGHCRSHLLSEQKFIQEAKTQNGYTIFNCGGFPGLIESESGFVEGEVWDVDEQYIEYLDRVEGSPYLYKLQPIKIEGLDSVSAYFWQKNTKNLKECGTVWKKEFGEC